MEKEVALVKTSKFGEFINKLKSFFAKFAKKNESVKEAENLLYEQEYIEVEGNIKEEKQKFVDLVMKFNAREIEEKDLTAEEKEQLTKYYKNKNKELDKRIENQKSVLENLNFKLNRYYEKVMKLKAE